MVDDCSTDDTAKIIKTLNVPHIINKERKGKIANLVKGFSIMGGYPEDIQMDIDGDDWLADNNVLSYLNKVYQDKNIWHTYGQLKDLAGVIPPTYSKTLERTDNYRENYYAGIWQTSMLRTYKKKVWDKIKDEDLRDKDGEYYKWAGDVFITFPMIEMCGTKHIKCLDKILYIYNNLNPINEFRVDTATQLNVTEEIKSKPVYKELPDKIVCSILIPAFKRPHLLKWGLFTLSQQKTSYSFEVIVLNDGIKDETEEICKLYKDKLNIRYIFTGQRNETTDHWRMPGFAINIGIKQALGEVVILMCAEMFLLDDCLTDMIKPILENKKLITKPKEGKWDGENKFLPYVEKQKGIIGKNNPYNSLRRLQVELPFFMGINKQEIISIGGYDEDFIGLGWDDNDLMERLQSNGCRLENINTRVVHLYHVTTEFKVDRDPVIEKSFLINTELYQHRKGLIIRNKNRGWGVYENPEPIKWYLSKIPKILHVYWGNDCLPFLNYLTLYSFHKFNPDWEIRYYTPLHRCIHRTWKGNENKHFFIGGDYSYLLRYIPMTRIVFSFETIGWGEQMSEVFKADILRYYLLSKDGGLWSDMDIMYFAPMTSLETNTEENKDIDTIVSLHPIYKHSIGFFLSSPKNSYYQYLSKKQLQTWNSENYQSIGSEMINDSFPNLETIKRKFPELYPINMPIKTVYAYDAMDVPAIYISNDMSKYDISSIGLHWYGGHPVVGKYLDEITLENYKNYDNVLGKTIRKIYENT